MNKQLKDHVIGFKPINERLCAIRIKTRFANLWLINAHAPTEVKEDAIKDEFYNDLETLFDSLPSNDVKLLLGDFNAKVGNESWHRGTTGGHSLHDENNNNGQRLIDFASGRNLVISSTCFPHRRIHKQTWKSPDEYTVNQIDHVLISKRWASNVLDVRSYRGANCDTDHYLVKTTYRCRISSVHLTRINPAKIFEVDNLIDDATAAAYTTALEEKLSPMLDNINNLGIHEFWEELKDSIKGVAEEVVGYKGRRRRADWFDDECRASIEAKNEAYRQYTQRACRANKERYNELRRVSNRLIRRKKRKHFDEQLQQINQRLASKNIRQAYKLINNVKNGYQPRTSLCKDKDGNIISDIESVNKRWASHFEELLNAPSTSPAEPALEQLAEPGPPVLPPTVEEVSLAIQSLQNNKAPGADEIPAELLKHGGTCLTNAVHVLLLKIWNDEVIPEDWRKSIICPIHKKGDKLKCENYRGISLVCTAYKILSKILEKRINPYAERIIGEYQGGFRPGRSTTDQLFTVKLLLQKCWEYNIDVYQIFVDFKQAYDSIDRSVLYNIMLNFGIPAKLVRLTRMTMTNTVSQVRVQNRLTDLFETRTGLKQGDGLAPTLFNLALEYVIRAMNMDSSGTLLIKSTQLVAYADDINIMSRRLGDAESLLHNLNNAAKEVGLHINESKTKAMMQSKTRTPANSSITVGDLNIEYVDNFNYLGCNLSKDANETDEIKRRIQLANKTYFSVLPIINSKLAHRNTKLRVYKTIIRPVLCYGCETWTLTQASEILLDRFERKVLRRIFGAVRERDQWRIRYNHELYQLYDELEVSKIVKLQRLQWAGHVQRMDDNRMPKKVMNAQRIDGARLRGRPRARWENSVGEDAHQLLGFRNWRTRSRNRDNWRSTIQAAKARRRAIVPH